MERWLEQEDDPTSSDALHIIRKLQNIGFCSDPDLFADPSCFDHILSVFLNKLHRRREIRPIPVMIGDGKPIDLYKLYRLVSERGGYNAVTSNNAWALVAEGIGLDSVLGSPLKLIYAKYLITLEHCLQRVHANWSGAGGFSWLEKNLRPSMSDSESEVRTLFNEILKQKKKNGTDMTILPCSKRDKFLTPSRQNEPMLLFDNSKCGHLNGSADMGQKLENRSTSYLMRKRKRDSLVGMLKWVKSIAENPLDPSNGKIMASHGLKETKSIVGLQFSHALQARKAVFLKESLKEDIDTFTSKKKQKKLPSVYQDCNADAAAIPILETSNCSQKTRSSNKPSFSSSCSKTSTVCTSAGHIGNTNVADNCQRMLRNSTLLPDYLAQSVLKRIPLGSFFQAKVPDWNGKSKILYDSDDLKWLGRRIWPLEYHEKKLYEKPNLIGKGREYAGCKCRNTGSIECVRFHVVEKRLQLKCELSAAFYAWRFHLMGEEVALSWEKAEEERFKAAFRLNQPPYSEDFWKLLLLCFPEKGNRNLVSYYFNVFLLQRRSYQNRVSPNSIDSDDEKFEFGFLNCTFDYDAIKFFDSGDVICTQNLQCVDLGD